MKSLKDRVADRNSFFMPGADLVQMEHHSMENMDTVDKTTPTHQLVRNKKSNNSLINVVRGARSEFGESVTFNSIPIDV
jgi:hypothetical protein